MMEMERFAYNTPECECYVAVDELRTAAQQDFPRSCLQNCRAQFLRRVLPGWKEDSGWSAGCQTLTSPVPNSALWPLYWCDSEFCGVAINQTGGLEQDRECCQKWLAGASGL